MTRILAIDSDTACVKLDSRCEGLCKFSAASAISGVPHCEWSTGRPALTSASIACVRWCNAAIRNTSRLI